MGRTLPSAPSSWNLPIAPLPPAPTFSVAAGTYSGSLNVALASVTGTSVYYTTDGTVPSAASIKYTGSIKVASTETINAIAEINPFLSSSIGTATYTISGSANSSTLPALPLRQTPMATSPVFLQPMAFTTSRSPITTRTGLRP